MDDTRFRRSQNIEDRRNEVLELGPFGTPGFPPNVFEGEGTMVNLDPKKDFAPQKGRTALGSALGLDTIEHNLLIQQQDNEVRDALDNASVAYPGDNDPNGPPVRVNHRFNANPVPLMSTVSGRDSSMAAIVQAARDAGEDPAYALAVAERENDKFDPRARTSKTIKGIYQMRGDLQEKYGVGDSDDPADQAAGWMRSLPDIRSSMRSVLGRDPTDQEVYLGHHFGATRAARTLKMDPSTPVDAIFTPQEMSLNPHFARAGTIGNLNETVMGDIGKRMARFGGSGSASTTSEPADLSAYGNPVASSEGATSKQQADLSSFGKPVEQPQPSAQAAASAPPDLAKFGTPVS